MDAKVITLGRKVFSVNVSGIIEYMYLKSETHTMCRKINLRWIINLNVKVKGLKLPERK